MSDDEGELCTQEIDSVVKEVVQVIMMLDFNKKPFKQSDIASHLSQKPPRKDWKGIIESAKKNLESLGLELVETPAKTFFVISKRRPLAILHKYSSDEDVANRILLTIVLAYIFMKHGIVNSGELLNHLKHLKICNESDLPHPYFGNVKKKVFSEFVDQLYLSSSKITESDMYKLEWGPRAEAEISKMSILEFVCQTGYNGTISPNNLVSHYEKAISQSLQQNPSVQTVE